MAVLKGSDMEELLVVSPQSTRCCLHNLPCKISVH